MVPSRSVPTGAGRSTLGRRRSPTSGHRRDVAPRSHRLFNDENQPTLDECGSSHEQIYHDQTHINQSGAEVDSGTCRIYEMLLRDTEVRCSHRSLDLP